MNNKRMSYKSNDEFGERELYYNVSAEDEPQDKNTARANVS